MIGRGTTLDPSIVACLGERDLVAQASEDMYVNQRSRCICWDTYLAVIFYIRLAQMRFQKS